MNRRNFIQKSTMLGGIALSHSSFTTKLLGRNFELGYQLFSIRDEMAIDPIQTLKRLKKAGYKDFEIYGYDAHQNNIYGYSPSELYQILEDMRLTVSSGHYGFADYLNKSDDQLLWFVDKCITTAHELKSSYIT